MYEFWKLSRISPDWEDFKEAGGEIIQTSSKSAGKCLSEVLASQYNQNKLDNIYSNIIYINNIKVGRW